MTAHVISLGPTESCERARAVMEAACVRRLTIVDRSRLVGIVTDGDLLRRVPYAPEHVDPNGGRNELLPHVNVGGVMTYAPVTGSPLMLVHEAAALMRRHLVNTLPVVDEGLRLVGILTMGDVFRASEHALQRP